MLSTRMPDKPIAILLEVVQFIPIIGFAFPFLVAGEVDVTTAAMPFMVTALLAVLITTGVAIMRAPVNPILLGSGLWLLLGAIGFGGGIAPLANALAALQGASLLACISTVAIAEANLLYFDKCGLEATYAEYAMGQLCMIVYAKGRVPA